MGFSGSSDGEESTWNVGDLGSIPGLRRSSGGRCGTHSNILAWTIPLDRGVWRAIVHGIAKSRTQLSDYHSLTHPHACTHMHSRLEFWLLQSFLLLQVIFILSLTPKAVFTAGNLPAESRCSADKDLEVKGMQSICLKKVHKTKLSHTVLLSLLAYSQ